MDSDLDDFMVIDLPPTQAVPRPKPAIPDPVFSLFVSVLQDTANARSKGPLFHAKLDLQDQNLFQLYLSSLQENLRQEHNCHSCRNFVSRFGDLCQVQDDGTLRPLVWPQPSNDRVPAIYHKVLENFNKLFQGRGVSQEYRLTSTNHLVLGELPTDASCFTHFHVQLGTINPLSNPLNHLSTDTAYDMLARVLDDYSLSVIHEAHHLLHHKLIHSTSHRPAVNWLKHIAEAMGTFSGGEVQKRNLITRYACEAPLGFLSALRGGIIGTLLTDIKSRLEFEIISQRWNNLANGLAYMRPTALPSAGNVKVAEKSFADLGYTKEDLMRYFMTIDQIPAAAILWKDQSYFKRLASTQAAGKGESRIFASLDSMLTGPSLATVFTDDQGPPTTISFRTFVRKILPNTEALELKIASVRVMRFFTIGAPGSKSPFYFGSETNTASWYRWGQAEKVSNLGLITGYCKVTAITTFPHMWEHMTAHEAVAFEDPSDDASEGTGEKTKRRWIGARDDIRFMFCLQSTKSDTGTTGLALFPSIMKGEFHGVRKTVEAFSDQHHIAQPLAGNGLAQVAGVCNLKNEWETLSVRVTLKSKIRTEYSIALFD